MDGVTKGQQRALTAAGAIVGIVVGLIVWNRVIGDEMIEVGRFVLAVFVGGAVAFLLYVLIKDGGSAILRKQGAAKTDTPAAPPTVPAPASVAEDEDDDEDEDEAPQRPLRARQRPLRPPNR